MPPNREKPLKKKQTWNNNPNLTNTTSRNTRPCTPANTSSTKERKKSKLDYRLEQQPTEEDVKRLEDAVNEVIGRNLDVTTDFITQEEARGRFDLQRLPDDASQTVRVVKVGDYDECLCIGTHVANTAEIGTFRIISHDWDEAEKRWRIRFKLVSPA